MRNILLLIATLLCLTAMFHAWGQSPPDSVDSRIVGLEHDLSSANGHIHNTDLQVIQNRNDISSLARTVADMQSDQKWELRIGWGIMALIIGAGPASNLKKTAKGILRTAVRADE